MYKSKLQELCQRRTWELPEYMMVRDGLDHNPRFTATVTVNGEAFETPKSQCRSSKEAQNLAAKLAFDHFNAPVTILQRQPQPQPQNNRVPSPSVASPLPSPHLSGSSSSSTHAAVRPNDQGILHPKHENNVQASRFNEIPYGCEDDKRPKDVLHMYKNRLQHYAQKHSLNLPTYSCEFHGPPHVRRFKSKVTIGDKTYETSEFFPTLKEAEHAAAKVAFESLAHDDIQEDEALYKTLLQQLAQKEGLRVPTYITIKSGAPHMPTFISTVEIGADVFQGQEAKTKKQAEMRAAKVAYNALIERRAAQIPPSGYHIKGASEVTSPNLQLIIDKGLQQEIANAHPMNMKEAAQHKENNLKEALEISSSSERSVFPADLQQTIQPKAELIANKELNAELQDAKRYRGSSSSEEVNAHLQDPLPLTSSSPHDPASPSTQLKYPNDLLSESENQKPTGVAPVSSNKIVVYPRNSEMAIPDGASMLPCSDDKWVAVTWC